ncbi:hypothetical protein MNBD_DELTA04-426 [hydrothermal vent metagenome]|uniref:Uncharacterized protein n=1 Tax=hydrothermal vent metagenome TaxID=652676 RepID=A0A3B0W6T0_9ZZZZ
MAGKKQSRRGKKTFRFQLSLAGVAGIGVVCFCLFLWMFLLGIWAGQTILLPTGTAVHSGRAKAGGAVQSLVPAGRKKPLRSTTG